MRHLCRTCAASALLETGSYAGVPDYMCRYAEESLRLLEEEEKRYRRTEMDKLFQIGEFVFRLCCPEEVTPPENFMKFECASGSPEYTYHIEVSDVLPRPEGKYRPAS